MYIEGSQVMITKILIFFLVDEGREDPRSKYHYKRAIIGPPVKPHYMAFLWHADDGPTLNAGLVAAIFQGIRTCIARKPYIFVKFSGGSGPPVPPSGSAHGTSADPDEMPNPGLHCLSKYPLRDFRYI